jgi:hypothetical protein
MNNKNIVDIKRQIFNELYSPTRHNLEPLLQDLSSNDLYDDIDGLPLINIPIIQDNKPLFELLHKYQPSFNRISTFIEFNRFHLFLNSFVKINDPKSIDFYSKDEYLLTYPIVNAFHSEFAIEWLRILKSLGMDFNYKYEPFGETCVHMLLNISIANKKKTRTLLEFLVKECGADINAQENILYLTPLMTLGHRFIDSFIDLGGDLDLKDKLGRTFLDYLFERKGSLRHDVFYKCVYKCLQKMFSVDWKTRYYFSTDLEFRNLVAKVDLERKYALFDFFL